MTPAQINDIGFHPRDRKGELKKPRVWTPPEQSEPSLERDLKILESVRGMMGREKYEAARLKLAARYKEAEDAPAAT